MKTIVISDKEIDIPTAWNNITFEKFNEFTKLVKSQKSLEELEEELVEVDESIKELQISLANIQMNTKLACFWTGLSEHEIAMCNIDEVEDVIASMSFLNEAYSPIALDSFKFQGTEYFLPKGGFEGENFGTFIEAEQIELNNKKLEKGVLDVLPRQIALLCKKKGEKRGLVNDALIDKREKKFKKLDMATIWDVGFFLTQHESSLMMLFLTSLRQEEMQKQELQQKKQ
tara:strand:- start:43 stop:729 length:687 start_codon:yes stop_codon:yes gene_type:complete